jgi:energy-coupling factor transporter ATP-binding protein EcfA2
MSRAEIRRKFDEIVAFAEVEKFLDTQVKHYSSGMYVRLAFAVAAHLEPEILIVDEVLAVGDAQFQKKCLGKMDSVAKENGRTVLFVSHNLQHIRQLCSCGLLLQAGQKSFHGNVHTALNTYYRQLEAPLESARRPDKCRIVNIRFTDGTGHQVERITRQETLWFSIELELGHDVRQPLVSVAVLHGDRQAVFSENWAAPAPLRAGTHRLQGCFDAAHLKCEQYFLTAFLFNGETCLDRVDGLSLPEITDAFADPLVESRRWGVARIAINWQMNSTAK